MKRNQWIILILLLALLPGGVGHAQANRTPRLSDPETYIQALEEAVDARYGGRDAWPKGFDAYLALARYYSGLDASYESPIAWASESLRALEATALSDKDNGWATVEFVLALTNEIEANEGFLRTWPYEAQALAGAVDFYSGSLNDVGCWILPGEEDLSEEEAIAIARKAIQEEYALMDESIDRLGIYTRFTEAWKGDPPFWSVYIGLRDGGTELYYAYVTSPAGEAVLVTRNDGNG